MKKIRIFFVLLCLFTVNISSVNAKENEQGLEKDQYIAVVEGEEWGAAYTKLIIKKDKNMTLIPTDYSVNVKQTVNSKVTGQEQAFIENVYECNQNGENGKGYIALELQKHPMLTTLSPYYFDADIFANKPANVSFTIELKKTGRIYDKQVRQLSEADVFEIGSTDYQTEWGETLTMQHASFTPKKDDHKNSLIIWLHGMGEGGDDPYLPVLGNEVTNFVSEEFQNIFNGAYVFVPQAQTFWLNEGNGNMTSNGYSMYEDQLMYVIEEYVNSHEDIDTNRIYIGGCSNGGYMTMRMLLKRPDYFAAAFPTCEAYKDRWISTDEIKQIRHIPIWFVQAKEDSLVNPNETTIPTYKRLLDNGAKDVHFTYLDNVIDPTGEYYYSDGKTPYTYDTHFSWVYTLDNKISKDFDGSPVIENGKELTLMEWLATRTKQPSAYEQPSFFENYGVLTLSVVFSATLIFLLTYKKKEK